METSTLLIFALVVAAVVFILLWCKIGQPAKTAAPRDSIDHHLEQLAQLGLRPCFDHFKQWMITEWGEELAFKNKEIIIASLSAEHKRSNGSWGPNSHDIFSFDTECIVDDSSYPELLWRFRELAKGDFDIENMQCNIDYDAGVALVSFYFMGRTTIFGLDYNNDDWFDIMLTNGLNKILSEKTATDKKFYYYMPDQTITVVYTDQPTAEALASFGCEFRSSLTRKTTMYPS